MVVASMYDRLLDFPLFQGMSREEITQMISKIRLEFIKIPQGKYLIHEGDVCDRLLFLLNGTIKIITRAHDLSYTVIEERYASIIIQPECLFAFMQKYRSTVRTVTACSLISIDKKEIIKLIDLSLVFRINIINLTSTQVQRIYFNLFRQCPKTLKGKIARFLMDRCSYPAGKKTFLILMKKLAEEVNDSQRDVSKALNEMQKDKLLVLSRGKIIVSMAEKIVGLQ